eukprot:SAG31_NODE_457_length_15415_cov_4.380387_11_plen_243_part_00
MVVGGNFSVSPNLRENTYFNLGAVLKTSHHHQGAHKPGDFVELARAPEAVCQRLVVLLGASDGAVVEIVPASHLGLVTPPNGIAGLAAHYFEATYLQAGDVILMCSAVIRRLVAAATLFSCEFITASARQPVDVGLQDMPAWIAALPPKQQILLWPYRKQGDPRANLLISDGASTWLTDATRAAAMPQAGAHPGLFEHDHTALVDAEELFFFDLNVGGAQLSGSHSHFCCLSPISFASRRAI